MKIVPASTIKAGFIQFGVTGNKDVKGIYTAGDENSIMFSKKEQEMAGELKVIVESKRKQSTFASSLADELRKLVTLKNEGILTEEAFQQQKQKLLK
ncbi:SHOCT domain-containing protein [Pseudobacillus wudalianchiensis]|uniref:SHOCT domain-containing protein n=1 Tax=Pseudobacillus wudalianchiensis TaxID=1743143 RepID=UPI0009813EAC|nr:SHOCT domain-containing protein [Bacillus wudalianchiensis]